MLKLGALLYALFFGALVLDAITEAPASDYVLVASGAHRAPISTREIIP